MKHKKGDWVIVQSFARLLSIKKPEHYTCCLEMASVLSERKVKIKVVGPDYYFVRLPWHLRLCRSEKTGFPYYLTDNMLED